MIDFKPLTIEFLAENRELLDSSGIRLCDYGPGCLFQWRESYGVRAAKVGDHVVFCSSAEYPVPADGEFYYSLPVGSGDPAPAYEAIVSDAAERGVRLRFASIAEEDVPKIISAVGREASVSFDPDESDYLYPIENFLGYPGKALHAHRNHVNRFLRENPDHAFEPLSDANRAEAVEFLRRHRHEMEKPDPRSVEELIRSEELLGVGESLGVTGGVLRVCGEVVGVTAGEVMGDMLNVCVEKALTEFHGAFPMLAMSYVEMMKREHPELKTVNRQDDCGDEGLRQSKQSYRPSEMLKKYMICFD
ncbi:MAG: DUF2156 domain-containing protein [Clostridia bacterium]|nr:DUF2156 domain-containing protein [Clostridia bacterium]